MFVVCYMHGEESVIKLASDINLQFDKEIFINV